MADRIPEPAIADGDFPAVTEAVRSGLADLLARLERAQGPDRELDEAIALWTYPELVAYPRSDVGGWVHPEYGKIAPAERFTGSLDAALGLVGRGLPGFGWCMRTDVASVHFANLYPVPNPERQYSGAYAHTPALALLCALVKALIARDGAEVSATRGRRVTTKSGAS